VMLEAVVVDDVEPAAVEADLGDGAHPLTPSADETECG
jgi:hypothetical protein